MNFESSTSSDKPNKEPNSRRDFLRKLGIIGSTTLLAPKVAISNVFEQKGIYTELLETNEKFKNGESVWEIISSGERVGEFWPIHGLNLVTKQTDPEVFQGELSDIHTRLRNVATAPDGMTGGSMSAYVMQGKALSSGRECGDGVVYNYGIIHVHNGFNITFTHKSEIPDYDEFYNNAKANKDTLFFLPSIFRNGNSLDSNKVLDKAFIRRNTPDGAQIGVVLFDKLTSYNNAREIILGLDRDNTSETTHIYYLDGANVWGQASKEVNGQVKNVGTRDKEAVTNYLVFY